MIHIDTHIPILYNTIMYDKVFTILFQNRKSAL